MLIAAGFTEIYTDTLISRIFFKRNWTFEYLPKDQMTLLKKSLKISSLLAMHSVTCNTSQVSQGVSVSGAFNVPDNWPITLFIHVIVPPLSICIQL